MKHTCMHGHILPPVRQDVAHPYLHAGSGFQTDQIRSYYISSSYTRLIRCLTLTWVHLLQTRIDKLDRPFTVQIAWAHRAIAIDLGCVNRATSELPSVMIMPTKQQMHRYGAYDAGQQCSSTLSSIGFRTSKCHRLGLKFSNQRSVPN